MQNGDQPVGPSAMQETVKWLNPKIDIICRRKQGSMDPESALAIARLNWTQQLLVHVGTIDLTTNNNQINRGLPMLCIHQNALWDEMHKEQIVGMVGNQSYHSHVMQIGNMTWRARFLKKLVPSSIWWNIQAKCRLALGVAAVLLIDGKEEGHWCEPDVYTMKTIITMAI